MGRAAVMKILLLDDDESFRWGVAENFRDDGHQVEDFAGPRQLPPLGALGDFDVVITDYQMDPADLDGLALADRLVALHPELPVVLVTACAAASLEAEVARRPRVHLRTKPCRYEDLRRLVVALGEAALASRSPACHR